MSQVMFAEAVLRWGAILWFL